MALLHGGAVRARFGAAVASTADFDVEVKTYIVQELGTSVPLDVVGVEVTPSQLNVDPELVASGTIENVLTIRDERWPRNVPLTTCQTFCKRIGQ